MSRLNPEPGRFLAHCLRNLGRPAALLGAALLVASVLPVSAGYAGSVWLPGVGGIANVPVKSLQERKFETVVRQQYDFSCGSAALATLLTYHYADSTSEQITFRYMYERGDRDRIGRVGFSLLDMKKYLEDHGYEADGYEASLDTLADAGIAAITLINYRGYQHFVVVKGITGNEVLVGDPALGIKTVSRQEFRSMWPTRILFIVKNHSEVGRSHFNGPDQWRTVVRAPLGTAVSRDSLASITVALPTYGDF